MPGRNSDQAPAEFVCMSPVDPGPAYQTTQHVRNFSAAEVTEHTNTIQAVIYTSI